MILLTIPAPPGLKTGIVNDVEAKWALSLLNHIALSVIQHVAVIKSAESCNHIYSPEICSCPSKNQSLIDSQLG